MNKALSSTFLFLSLIIIGLPVDAESCNWKPHFDKLVGQGDPHFLMVTMGDSVIWGQGHPLGEDFASRVQQWIQSQKGGTVRKIVYAHSGATIEPTADMYREDLHGEINWNTPTILQQVDCVTDAIATQTNLVLMDGCINDLHAEKILDPTVDRTWIRQQADTACRERMRSLLDKVNRRFPTAIILVTGYFPIVSAQSDPQQVAKLLNIFGPLGVLSGSISGLFMRNKVGANSAEWYQASNEILSEVVKEYDALSNRQHWAFVQIPFGPENAFGAPQSYLYEVPDDFGPNQDPVFGGRRRACMGFYRPGIDLIKCIKASAYHPNRRGVEAYKNAVIGVLEPLLKPSSLPVPIEAAADYDGDGRADLSVKTDDGRWLIHYGFEGWDATHPGHGGADAHPVPADYDGDGRADLSVKTDDGRWLINYAHNGFGGWDATHAGYGGADAHPVPADYDGDGEADLSVKTDDGRWLIDYARNGFGSWEEAYMGFPPRP